MSYWDDVYNGKILDPKVVIENSTFSLYVDKKLNKLGFIPHKCSILDLGCGNGRDTNFFLRQGYKCIGLDATKQIGEHYIQCDINNVPLQLLKNANVIYARFFIHSIRENEQNALFQKIKENCSPDVLLFIETRSFNDPMRLLGKKVSANENFTTHYRRYLKKEELDDTLKHFSFNVIESEELHGASPSFEDNPVLLRICASVNYYTPKCPKPSIILENAFQRIVNLLERQQIDYFPAYGTLLGLYRDKKPIDNDDDIDFWLSDFTSFEKLGVSFDINTNYFKNFYDYCGIQIDFYLLEKSEDRYIDRWNFQGPVLLPIYISLDALKWPLKENKIEDCLNLIEYLYGPKYTLKLKKFIEYQTIIENGIVRTEYKSL